MQQVHSQMRCLLMVLFSLETSDSRPKQVPIMLFSIRMLFLFKQLLQGCLLRCGCLFKLCDSVLGAVVT